MECDTGDVLGLENGDIRGVEQGKDDPAANKQYNADQGDGNEYWFSHKNTSWAKMKRLKLEMYSCKNTDQYENHTGKPCPKDRPFGHFCAFG